MAVALQHTLLTAEEIPLLETLLSSLAGTARRLQRKGAGFVVLLSGEEDLFHMKLWF